MTRRTALKTLAAGGTAATVGTGAGGDELAPVGDAEAIACGGLCLGAAAVGAGIAVGWALREYEVIGADSPADGLSADALRTEIDSTASARKSTNASTILDNRNIVKAGVENTAYGDAKLAAIQELNNQSQQSAVETAATEAINSYEETVIKNFLKSWNEAAQEANTLGLAAQEHSDVANNYLKPWDPQMNSVDEVNWDISSFADPPDRGETTQATRDYSFSNGNTFEVHTVHFQATQMDWGGSTTAWREYGLSPLKHEDDYIRHGDDFIRVGDGNVEYMHVTPWAEALGELEQAFTNARDGILLWVDNIYSQVQAGELNTEELLTSRELAAMTADDEEYNQAIADLMALNISVDLEREAEIYLPDDDVTLYGSLGTTGDTTLSVGTVDPTADDLDYYFTYDVSQGSGTWSDYNEGVDGGVVTFTAEPWEGTEFAIDTTAGETATVAASSFEDQGDGTWTVDVSDQLETAITNIDQVLVHSESSETNYQTVQLTDTFEIKTFTDSEGNEYDSAEHTSNKPHDDTNYITEEEWEEREERYTKLIDRYEESKGGGVGFDPSQFAWGPIPGVGVLGGAATLAAGFIAWAGTR